tara:strand:+ start:378 stop:1358 length:981 start_codon:yes stop_codon:yes gene_type:complete
VKRSKKKKITKKPWFWIILGVICGLFFFSFIFLSLIVAILSGASTTSATGTGNIALIPVEGAISASSASGYFSESGASSESIVTQIESANEDESIDAIVFWINSPGGSAVASDEIASAVLASEKPTVAVIREVGASGAYWIASATDYVIANRMSITGSIGVISSYLEFSELMENYGIGYQRLVAGENKDIGTPFRALAASEEDLLQGKLDLIHDYFIDAIASNRGLERMTVAAAATGEFYLGVEALELGLVDVLGDLDNAEAYLLETELIEVNGYVEYGASGSIFDMLAGLSVLHGFAIGDSIGSKIVDSGSSNLDNAFTESGVSI